MKKITLQQATDIMNEIAFAIIRTDFDKYTTCSKEDTETMNEIARTAFCSICKVLGIKEVEETKE